MAATAEEMGQCWDEFLEDVRCRVTRANFDTWLLGSRVLRSDGDSLVVGVVHAAAAEWIEKRLLPVHRGILERYFPGVVVQVLPLSDAENGTGRGPGPAGAPPAAGETKDQPAVALPARARNTRAGKASSGKPPVEEETDEEAGDQGDGDDEAIEFDAVIDPALARFDVSMAGWSKLANYALEFWAELLGPVAFMTWMVVRHEDIRRNKTEWTPTMSYSVRHLAALAAGGNSQAITGVWRTCHAASMAKRGEPCPKCAERGGQIVEPHACRYWRPGALDRLRAEGVAVVERRGKPPRLTYRVRVFNLLPLLTPAQVADLEPVSQQLHSRWLRKQDLDAASWEQLTVRHLVLPPIERDR